MKRFMVLVEDLSSCKGSFFDDYTSALDFVESARNAGLWVELYVRRERWIENHIAGYEYRRID